MFYTAEAIERLRQCGADYQPAKIEGEYPEAAVLVPLVDLKNELHLLLTQRASHMSSHAGESAFPGGKKDEADESLLATALREVDEEIGLSHHHVEPIFQLDQRLSKHKLKVTPFVGFANSVDNISINPHEIAQVFYVPLSFFQDEDNIEYREYTLHGNNVRSPCFHYQQHTIWGLTARVVVDLMNVVFDAGLEP